MKLKLNEPGTAAEWTIGANNTVKWSYRGELGATVQITGNYANGQDVLSFTNQNGITGSWNTTTGELTLTGSATKAQYEAALRSVTYHNTSEDPSTATRTISFTVNDGDANSNTQTRDITFTAVNDAAGDSVLTYSGGTIIVQSVSGLTLAQWNDLIVP